MRKRRLSLKNSDLYIETSLKAVLTVFHFWLVLNNVNGMCITFLNPMYILHLQLCQIFSGWLKIYGFCLR